MPILPQCLLFQNIVRIVSDATFYLNSAKQMEPTQLTCLLQSGSNESQILRLWTIQIAESWKGLCEVRKEMLGMQSEQIPANFYTALVKKPLYTNQCVYHQIWCASLHILWAHVCKYLSIQECSTAILVFSTHSYHTVWTFCMFYVLKSLPLNYFMQKLYCAMPFYCLVSHNRPK